MMLSITLLLILANVGISLACFQNKELFYKLSLNPYAVHHRKEWHRLFTHAFVHGDFMHLGLNMCALWMFSGEQTPFGNIFLEESFVSHFGSAKGEFFFLLLYVGGILFSSLSAMRRHRDNPGYDAVGASGATSAVIFAFILLNPLQGLGIIFIPVYIPGFLFGLLYLLLESYMDKRGQTHIAHDAHIYGALFGFIFPMALDYEFLLYFIESIRAYAGI